MRKLIFIIIALISFSQAQTIQYIGAPTTTVISRGNFRTDSIFYLPKRTKTPTDTAAFRYQISDSSLYYWTGYQWTKVQSASSFASVDTNIISTRAWRQKGIDSVQYNVGLKVNISDTASMLSPYIVGSGTSNYFPKFNSTRSVINSKLYESNLNLLFNSTTPYLTTSGISTIENNGTSAALYILKTLDTARAYVSFGGANTMDINNLRAGDIRFYTNATLRGRFQTDGTFRLNSLTGTGSRIVVADDNGVLSATSSATGLVDTTLLSTRAYRQKGDDSLGAIIATKGSGTVTSVGTGYGLSGGTITTTGTLIADTLNLSTRAWRQKGLDSLAALEISGSGTTNYVPKFTNTRELGNSVIYNAGGLVGINTASPVEMLSLSGGTGTNFGVSINPSGWNGAKHRYTVPTSGDESVISHNYNGSAVDFSSYATSAIGIGNGIVRFSTGGINAAPSERARFNAAGRFLINTTSDAGAYTLQNNGALYNTGSAILAANGTSHVGIGTVPSAWSWLSSIMQFRFGGHIAVADNSFMQIGANSYYDGSNYVRVNAGYASRYLQNDGGHFWASATTSTAGSTVTFSENMRLTRDAELLVGTTTDAGNYRVQVSGNAYISGILNIGDVGSEYINVTADQNSSVSTRIRNNNTGSSAYAMVGVNASGNSWGFRMGSSAANNNALEIVSNAFGTPVSRLNITTGGIVGIGTTSPNASSIVDISSTTGGFLPPRMTTAQRDAISLPAAGLVIYNTTTSKLQVYTTSWTDLH